MEILVRLATTKYVKSGIAPSVVEAVQKLFADQVEPFLGKFNSMTFRKDSLWCEDCDLVYKRSINALKQLYGKYSGKYAMPGATKYMSMDEFIEMITTSGVVDDTFGAREISPFYNLAMMT